MPTVPNTHETARAISPGARVVCLDNDAVVLSHLRALAAKGNPSVTVVDGDVREVAASLDAVAAGIDLSAPACLLMGFLLHLFEPTPRGTWWPGTSRPWRRGVMSYYRSAAPTPKRRRGLQHLLLRGGAGVQPLGAGLRQLLGALELVPPGVVDAREWRPGWTGHAPPAS